MKSVAILLLVSTVAFAQHRGGAARGGVHSPGYTPGVTHTGGGFGNVLFPGGFIPGDRRPTPGISAGGRQYNRGGAAYIPYAVPYYMYDPAPQQPVTVVQPAPPPPTTVIINNHYTPERAAAPVVREYNFDTAGGPSDGVRVYDSPREESASSNEERRNYLIAFKDNTIYAAFTYWLEGDTLHYVTLRGTHNQVSIGLIDRELTLRLNRERGVEFRLK